MVIISGIEKCRGRLFVHCSSGTHALSFCFTILSKLAFILMIVVSWSQLQASKPHSRQGELYLGTLLI